MNVGIIGSGGRENSICFALSKSSKVDKIFCMPGNGGTENISKNLIININNFQEIKNAVEKNNIDLLIIGPEKPLVDGIVDFFENSIESKKFIDNSSFPIVIKADGLASGKGVYISENKHEAYSAVDEIFNGKFGQAKNILIEEFLVGEEMSYFIITDGESIKAFETAQDHKRVNEGDKGQNTGGMGAYSPSRLINKSLENKIINKIISPTLKGLKHMGIEYKGFLYAGLMIKNKEPYLIEYNVRMGDPECQTILPKLETDLIEVLLSCCEKKLNKIDIQWNEKKSLSIVLCSKGYPNEYKKNLIIKNIKKIITDQNNFCFHAGTILKDNEILAVGGRVLNFISMAHSFSKARQDIIKNIDILNWESGFYRKDIGYKVIDE